jgi:sulfur dioxygenase
MLFRQLVHRESSTYTYLVGSRPGGKGLIIDPVADHLELYLRLIEAFDLRLELALETHFHTDHVSALGPLRERTGCAIARGRESSSGVVNSGSPDISSNPGMFGSPLRPLQDGETFDLDGIELEVLHTPGHTPDSYSFVMDDRVFTGDTLLIRSTGRTDQGGDARVQHESLSRLLGLPGRTLVYPAHDYHGHHVSSIADERRHNPRLKLQTIDEYVALMESLRPSHVDHMDVVESSSLRRSGVLLRELAGLRAALAPDVASSDVASSDIASSDIASSDIASSDIAPSDVARSARSVFDSAASGSAASGSAASDSAASDSAASGAFRDRSFASAAGWSPLPPAVRDRAPRAPAEQLFGESAPSFTGWRARRGGPG